MRRFALATLAAAIGLGLLGDWLRHKEGGRRLVTAFRVHGVSCQCCQLRSRSRSPSCVSHRPLVAASAVRRVGCSLVHADGLKASSGRGSLASANALICRWAGVEIDETSPLRCRLP